MQGLPVSVPCDPTDGACMQINVSREKKLTNVRSKQADDKMFVPPPRVLTLEESIGFIQPDELIEVTPNAIRLRKVTLEKGRGERKKKASGG